MNECTDALMSSVRSGASAGFAYILGFRDDLHLVSGNPHLRALQCRITVLINSAKATSKQLA